jgi:hypothetical protein
MDYRQHFTYSGLLDLLEHLNTRDDA